MTTKQPGATEDVGRCEDCPIGGREGDGPVCPHVDECDRECAEFSAAMERDRTPQASEGATLERRALRIAESMVDELAGAILVALRDAEARGRSAERTPDADEKCALCDGYRWQHCVRVTSAGTACYFQATPQCHPEDNPKP